MTAPVTTSNASEGHVSDGTSLLIYSLTISQIHPGRLVVMVIRSDTYEVVRPDLIVIPPD